MGRPIVERPAAAESSAPHLHRILGLWDLVIYGLITVSPTGPINVFGVALTLSRGHAIFAILNGMIAMVLTAISYGRMASLYPSAGSVYIYASRALNRRWGLAAGWGMLLDYVAMPLFCVVFGALLAQRLLPHLPYPLAAATFAAGVTAVNLCGLRSVARINRVILGVTLVVFGIFTVMAVHSLFRSAGWEGLISSHPFYDPKTFQWGALAAGTSFAALTFLGFDSVTTLAEEVKNPKRNVLLAIVIVVLVTGIFSAAVVYIGQQVWPAYQTLSNADTGFMDVVGRVGGRALYITFTALLILASAGSAVTAQAGAARLLFGLGRDNILPKAFAYLAPKTGNPTGNIVLLGLVAFFGSFLIDYELASEILVFGAFIGFIVVNLAVIQQFYLKGVPGRRRRVFSDLIAPAAGLVFCVVITIGLPMRARIAGSLWFAAGFAYYQYWFRRRPAPKHS